MKASASVDRSLGRTKVRPYGSSSVGRAALQCRRQPDGSSNVRRAALQCRRQPYGSSSVRRAALQCRRQRALAAIVSALIALATLAVSHAQLRVQPVAEYPGDVAYRLALRKLTSIGTFMQVTAHPD